MEYRSGLSVKVESPPPRPQALPMTEGAATPHADAEGITAELIGDVVAEFYRRARRDGRLGPVFEAHVEEWDAHLVRMTDFWSSALLRTGRYSGSPVERHRSITGLGAVHFDRWVELFEATVRDLCSPREAGAFLTRARRMREAMTKVLGVGGGAGGDPEEPRTGSTLARAMTTGSENEAGFRVPCR
jgi:hemoglobin